MALPRRWRDQRQGVVRVVAARRHANRRVAATLHQTRPGSIGGAVAVVKARTHAAEDPGKAVAKVSG